MEPIKINVSVELNLSQATEDFIFLVANGIAANSAIPAAKPAPQPAPAKPATTVAKPVPQPAPTKPATAAAKPALSEEVSIEDVRKALSLKVNDHRTEIKGKLNEFGAPSVTKLDPANYKEMLDFLNALD